LTFPALLPHLLLRLLVASDFVVSSQLLQPHSLMRFVFLKSQVCFQLLSDIPSQSCPCLPLAVGATSSARLFHPLANAHAGHTKKTNTAEQPCSFFYLKEAPHHAVYSDVLNLPSQVGFRLGRSALAEAYRVTAVRLEPYKWVLAQNAMAATRTQQGTHLIPQKKGSE